MMDTLSYLNFSDKTTWLYQLKRIWTLQMHVDMRDQLKSNPSCIVESSFNFSILVKLKSKHWFKKSSHDFIVSHFSESGPHPHPGITHLYQKVAHIPTKG